MRAYQPSLQDPKAFSDLYDRTHMIIFRFIYGLHGGPIEEVEDLTCDTFFRAWRGRVRFSGNDHDALCWLFTIARRLVIDAHRHIRATAVEPLVRLDDTNMENILPTSQETPEEQAAARDQFKQLWKILQGLPEDKRELLVLRYILGWRVKEVAEYLRMEENTISVYIKRCLEQIRDEWSAE
jgi:RNA polymerase sigma-70 factor (ECF subfamily)